VLLTIDIGNTNVALGLFDEARLEHHWRTGTHHHYTSDEYATLLRSLLQLARVEPQAVDDAIISCVVPPLLPIFERTCSKLFGGRPLVVGPGIRTGMPIRTDNPREVGADRIVNAVAAYALLGGPAIAIDFGTATTLDCISAGGEYIGGAIFPGVLVALEALVQRASKLSAVEVERPPAVIGRNTVHMLQSGMVFGYAGLVDAMVERMREELGAQPHVVATGGLAGLIAAETKSIGRLEPFLTLEGLRLIHERNRETGSARRADDPHSREGE
jgi:type III pantothenate kinase